jgi:hypothetical protein
MKVEIDKETKGHIRVGWWLRHKYKKRALTVGHYKVALQLRKQGIPLEIARLILL